MQRNNTDRRTFIKRYAAVASGLILVPTIIPACSRGKDGNVAPSDRINVAFIGAGNQAFNDSRDFMNDERVQITTVCDVNKSSMGYWDGVIGGREPMIAMIEKGYSEKNGKKFKGIKGYEDFREVIALKDVDAVEVVVPDHWHSIPVLMAAAAGKDIYCQ